VSLPYPSDLITPKEAAELLRINVETVRRLLRTGQLPGCKVGPRQWRTRRVDLDAYLHPARSEAGEPKAER
jgi:excisionase family DNA binding protein